MYFRHSCFVPWIYVKSYASYTPLCIPKTIDQGCHLIANINSLKAMVVRQYIFARLPCDHPSINYHHFPISETRVNRLCLNTQMRESIVYQYIMLIPYLLYVSHQSLSDRMYFWKWLYRTYTIVGRKAYISIVVSFYSKNIFLFNLNLFSLVRCFVYIIFISNDDDNNGINKLFLVNK